VITHPKFASNPLSFGSPDQYERYNTLCMSASPCAPAASELDCHHVNLIAPYNPLKPRLAYLADQWSNLKVVLPKLLAACRPMSLDPLLAGRTFRLRCTRGPRGTPI